jgi:putative RecB family exonuclease
MTEETERKKRSPSQVGDMQRCPHMYYLKRIERVAKRPAAWLPQGTAFHNAAEAFERSSRTMTLEDLKEVYTEAYDAESNRFCAEWPDLSTWSASGPYTAWEDITRRHAIGMEMVEKYVKWTEKNPAYVPYVIGPDGERAIELDLNGTFGDVPVNGKVDVVYWNTELKALRVVDWKTGNKPGDSFQLGTYGDLIRQVYEDRIDVGFYWMGKTGNLTRASYDLTEWSYDSLTEVYESVDAQINAGDFPADPEPDKCWSCSVNHACVFRA